MLGGEAAGDTLKAAQAGIATERKFDTQNDAGAGGGSGSGPGRAGKRRRADAAPLWPRGGG